MEKMKRTFVIVYFGLALTLGIPILALTFQTLTVSAKEAKDSMILDGQEAVEDPYINIDTLSLYVGQREDLYINGLSVNDNMFSGDWRTSDTSVATVDMSGRIIAVGAGKATITFDYKVYGKATKTYTCQVTVTHGPITTTTVPESDKGETMETTSHVVFIMNHNLSNAKVAEFYKYLEASGTRSTIDCIYTYSISTLLMDETAMSKIADADRIIMIGVQLSNDNLDTLKTSVNSDANFYFVTCLGFNERFLDSKRLNILSARQVWIDMYYANIADATQLNFTNPDSRPTLTAGLGVAIYLQYKINNNGCTETSYTDLTKMMDAEALNEIGEERFNKIKELLTEDQTAPANEDNPILHLSEVNRPDLINQYAETLYPVFDVFYNYSSRGIFSIEQTTDGTPICFDTVTLDSCKLYGNSVYAWIGGKWKLQTSYPEDEYALKVLTWSDGKWNTKVYRYTDNTSDANPLKTSIAMNIQQDASGNWYMEINKNDKYYIYQLDKHLKVKYKVCVSDLTDSQYADYHLLMNGKVIIETYESADTSSSEANWYEGLRLYKNLQLINLKSGKITREYKTGYYPYGYVKVKGQYIYMRDKSLENIVVIDSYSGNVVNVIYLPDYDYLIKPHDYSEELGFQYDYDYAISGKYIYILKKTGIYRIDMGNGKFRKIMDDSYKPFGIQDMRFLDFKVKDNDTFYILAVYFDEECATNFYSYTREAEETRLQKYR